MMLMRAGPLFSSNAITVLERRYLKKDADGAVTETPTQMLERVARTVADADGLYGATKGDIERTTADFYDLMANLEFLPNSPTLMNAGRDLGQLSACFVLELPDDIEGIFETIKHTAMIHKSGGGTGFDASKIRPKNAPVGSTGGVASGPVSFLSVIDKATEEIKQGGTRRGANMGVLRVDHPDIVEFIDAKEDTSVLTNFNLSVGLTEVFMRAVREDTAFALVNPHDGTQADSVAARPIFDRIVDRAWRTGEPGIVFLDQINRFNTVPHIGPIAATNPCGELPLLPYESCNLGSLVLSHMVHNNELDEARLRRNVRRAVHFLDNVVDANRYPLPMIEQMSKGNRKIGLGIMGWADLLFRLGIPYGSEQSLEMADTVMGLVNEEARLASKELAVKRGNFPNHEGSVFGKHPMRNATRTTIAPTGTISILAGCSSGIEPLFALGFTRRVMDGDELPEVNAVFAATAKEEGFYSEELMRQVASGKPLPEIRLPIPEHVREVFVTAHDVSAEAHLRMQAVFQKHVNSAVSKTINLPREATRGDVEQVFLLAHELGCKGLTVYRDGSRQSQVLVRGDGRTEEHMTSESTTLRVKTTSEALDAELAKLWPPRKQGDLDAKTMVVKDEKGRNRFGLAIAYTGGHHEKRFHEVWCLMEESGGLTSRRVLPFLAKLSSKVGRADIGALREVLEGVLKWAKCYPGQHPFDLRLNGTTVYVSGNVEAFALLLIYHLEKAGVLREGNRGVLLSHKLCAREPKTGAAGTSAWMFDVRNPTTGDDLAVFVKEAEIVIDNVIRERRPVSFWADGTFPPEWHAVFIFLSKLAQVGPAALAIEALKDLEELPEAGGDFRAPIPGDPEGRSRMYESTLAYVAALLVHRYAQLGLTGAAAAIGEDGEQITGRRCPICGRPTVIKDRGCDYCTSPTCPSKETGEPVGNCG